MDAACIDWCVSCACPLRALFPLLFLLLFAGFVAMSSFVAAF